MLRTLVKRHICGRNDSKCLDRHSGKVETGGFLKGHYPDSLAYLLRSRIVRDCIKQTNIHTNIQAGKNKTRWIARKDPHLRLSFVLCTHIPTYMNMHTPTQAHKKNGSEHTRAGLY